MENIDSNDIFCPICPTCGSRMGWDSSAQRCELGHDTDDDEMVHFYHCSNCGGDFEFYECFKSERHEYPYWQEKEKESTTDDSQS